MPQTATIKQLRQRQLLINKVRNYWIKGVLEKSLYNQVLIELNLQERLDAIESPTGITWNTSEESRQELPSKTRIIDFFEEMGLGRSLLILGEAGSGKTTALIEIARHLIIKAEQNNNHPIPVIFNLASWGEHQKSISEWLEYELNSQYQIDSKVSKTWLKQQQLLLLLDELDELTTEKRHLCVQAINNFRKKCGDTEIIVCSRNKDYEVIPEKLRLQNSVYLQPLTLEQVQSYLASLGSQVAVISNLLEQDKKLQDLVTTPLMININL